MFHICLLKKKKKHKEDGLFIFKKMELHIEDFKAGFSVQIDC